MTLEFFLVLVAVVGVMAAAMWGYCAIFDFVDAWKKKRDRVMLSKGRLPPMTPLEETCASRERSMLAHKTLMLKRDDLNGMTTGLYDYDAPTGPPSGHERRPKLPKARRMMD